MPGRSERRNGQVDSYQHAPCGILFHGAGWRRGRWLLSWSRHALQTPARPQHGWLPSTAGLPARCVGALSPCSFCRCTYWSLAGGWHLAIGATPPRLDCAAQFCLWRHESLPYRECTSTTLYRINYKSSASRTSLLSIYCHITEMRDARSAKDVERKADDADGDAVRRVRWLSRLDSMCRV